MIVGLDYGRKRCGLAVANASWVFEREALPTLPQEVFFAAIQRMIETEHVTRIVVGMPYGMHSAQSNMSAEVEEFINVLREKVRVPVESWDERLTTAEAKRNLRSQEVSSQNLAKRKDSLSAKLMLESFIAAHPAL